jgi:two-component system, sensor histidine kinase
MSDVTVALDSLILSEQLRAYYASMKPAAIAGTVGPLLVAATFWPIVPHWQILLWWCLVAVTLGVGSLLLRRKFMARNELPLGAHFWLRMAAIRALIVSLAYGSMGVLLFSPESSAYQVMLFAWIIAISALVTIESANHRWLYLATLLPMTLPFTLRASWDGGNTALILAAATAILLAYLVAGANKLNRLITDSLQSRFVNAGLVQQLQQQVGITESALIEATEANRSKSRFLAAASHDLRQPIHALGLFVSAVRSHVTDAEGQRIVQRMSHAVDSTEILFNAMLDVSRLDAGVHIPDLRTFSLKQLLHRLVIEYMPLAEAKGLQLRLRGCDYTVVTDSMLLERVVRNYLGNAIRYTRRGGAVLGVRRRGESVSVELWDTGQGIAADKLGDIYQEFYQVGNPERDRSEGLGLGLAIVRRIAQLLGHHHVVKSRLGRGSMFSIEVPLAAQHSLQADDGVPNQFMDDALLIGACVLVIDDEPDARDATEVVLKQWGCLVLVADSADHALGVIARQERPLNVILSDFRLREGRTGVEAINMIIAAVGATSAVLISGDTAPDRLQDAAASGYELLHKPLSPLRLKQTLCRLLAEQLRKE